jgi:hypothetical protein
MLLVEWKSSMLDFGEQCVIANSAKRMPVWFADHLDSGRLGKRQH